MLGLYNFSSSPFQIVPGKKVIAAKLFRLEGNEVTNDVAVSSPIEDFPGELCRLMENYQPVSFHAVQEGIKSLEGKLEAFKDEVRQKEDWFKKFQESLEKLEHETEKITRSLDIEINDRKRADDNFPVLCGCLKKIKKNLCKPYKIGIVIFHLGVPYGFLVF